MKSIRVVFIVRILLGVLFFFYVRVSFLVKPLRNKQTDLSEPIDVYNEWINELNEERDSGSEDSDSD